MIPMGKMAPKEKAAPNGVGPNGIPEEEIHCRKRRKRISMTHRVIILRRQRERELAAIGSRNGSHVSYATG